MDLTHFLEEEISGSITPPATLLLFVCNWSPAGGELLKLLPHLRKSNISI